MSAGAAGPRGGPGAFGGGGFGRPGGVFPHGEPRIDFLEQKYVVDDTNPKAINSIQFSMMSGDQMCRASELRVTNRELYKPLTRDPYPYGPLDSHLGTSIKKGECATCGESVDNCPGHFGVIHLAVPVFHIGFAKQILAVLRMVCKTCSRILLHPSEIAIFRKTVRSKKNFDMARRKEVQKKIQKVCVGKKSCPYCHAANGDVKKAKGSQMKFFNSFAKNKGGKDEDKRKDAPWMSQFTYAVSANPEIEEYLKNAVEDLNPLRVKHIFEKIIAEDCELLAMDPRLARPEWMLLDKLPVPPACIRPSVLMDQQGGSNEDDLTMRLQEIMLLNQVVIGDLTKGPTPQSLMEKWECLQFAVAHYINSDTTGAPANFQPKQGRGICQRLKGKTGRFRGNLSGKRVDFSSRTVISPDPNLRIDEVGVPRDVAMILSYPEVVNKVNRQRMERLVRAGPNEHPGARYIVWKKDGSRTHLGYGNREMHAKNLCEGDIVERHLEDGDVVLFNRQPSLHRVSIMAHRARVMPWKTFRFNECVCTPYNADFDGDEMNLHLPQTEEARAEALMLMSVPQNLAVPKSGELLIGATQDFLTACWVITGRDSFYTRSEFCQIIAGFSPAGERIRVPPPTIYKPVELWTGKQIFSVLISPNDERTIEVNMDMKLKNYMQKENFYEMASNDAYMVVYRGQLLAGQIDKSAIGGGKTTLFAHMLKHFSAEVAVDRMSKLARMCARFLGNRGFSIGISDVTPAKTVVERKAKLVEKGYAECDKVIGDSNAGKLEAAPGCSVEQTLEASLNKTLSDLRDAAGGIAMDYLTMNDKHNSPLIMAQCGSKGSKINIAQMVVCVGQQTLSGQRIPEGFISRTLPHFDVNARTPAAKGFVKHSFFDGLTATEFFFHTMGGREGLIDTAVKTAETGYMQRRLMKALEDLSVQYDNTVRSSNGTVVQFKYGDDGMEPTLTEVDEHPVDFDRLWNSVVNSNLKVDFANPEHRPLLPNEIMRMVNAKLDTPEMRIYVDQIKKNIRDYFGGVCQRLTLLRERMGLSSKQVEFGSLPRGADPNVFSKQPTEENREKMVAQLLAVTKKQLDVFFVRVGLKLRAGTVEPGTAVGALCAQSIGEPCTQMTLKTFHFAGVASMNITMGVPRIREIINATKKIATPVIEVQLEQKNSLEAAKTARGYIERTTLADIALYIKEHYQADAPTASIVIKLDEARAHALRVHVSIQDVLAAIIAHRKLKLNAALASVGGKNANKIIILPPAPEKFFTASAKKVAVKNVYFVIQVLKQMLPGVVVSGIDSCTRCVIKTVEDKQSSPPLPTYSVLVEGNDLIGSLAAPGANVEKSTTNHILEVNRCLGIEAARKAIVQQIHETMKSHSVAVDPRHLNLLADCMTYKGEVLGITRFGVSKMKDSVLMLASFEKTTDYLFDAGQRALTEPVEGVSECIIMGRPIPLGTGLFRLLHKSPAEVIPPGAKQVAYTPRPVLFPKVDRIVPIATTN